MKYLRACLVGTRPEIVKAFEYESEIYLSQARVPVLPSVSWESDALETKELIELLRTRGWHTTDIGDALDETRKTHRREA
jgi:hypothetical protein